MISFLRHFNSPRTPKGVALFVFINAAVAVLSSALFTIAFVGKHDTGPFWSTGLILSTMIPLMFCPPVFLIMGLTIMRLNRTRIELENLVRIDPMTGTLNRRGFFERAERVKTSLAGKGTYVLLLDIDHFKTINDTYGHAIGDHVISEVANVIRRVVEPNHGFAARLGGDELGALLVDVKPDQAKALAERIRASIAKANFTLDDSIVKVTCSIGLAPVCAKDGPIDTSIAHADKAMYEAKELGRNCLRVYADSTHAIALVAAPPLSPSPAPSPHLKSVNPAA